MLPTLYWKVAAVHPSTTATGADWGRWDELVLSLPAWDGKATLAETPEIRDQTKLTL